MKGRGFTTMLCITQEIFKVNSTNIWSEFVHFPERVDQMQTEISQLQDN